MTRRNGRRVFLVRVVGRAFELGSGCPGKKAFLPTRCRSARGLLPVSCPWRARSPGGGLAALALAAPSSSNAKCHLMSEMITSGIGTFRSPALDLGGPNSKPPPLLSHSVAHSRKERWEDR
jgi:hypothetical protein